MIRNAVNTDEKAVYQLLKQLSRQEFTPEQFHRCFDYHLNMETYQILVVEEEGIVQGCIVLYIHFPLHFSQRVMEVANLIIDENERGRGLGGELLKAAAKYAAETDCVRIEVDSGRWRKDAHRFYEREGFKPTHLKLTKELKGETADAQNLYGH